MLTVQPLQGILPKVNVAPSTPASNLKVAQTPLIQKKLNITTAQPTQKINGVVSATPQTLNPTVQMSNQGTQQLGLGGNTETITKASPYLGTDKEKTIADLGWKVKQKYPQYADLSDEELGAKMKAKFPEYADFADQPKISQEEYDKQTLSEMDYSAKYDAPGTAALKSLYVQGGLLDRVKSGITGIAKPFIKVAGSGIRALESTPDLLRALGGNEEANIRTQETMAKPILGQKTLAGSSNLQNFGTGLEVGSNLIGAKGFGQVIDQTVNTGVKEAVKTGVKQGVKAGFTGGTGGYLANTENPTFGGTLKAGAQGATAGAFAGGITPAFIAPKEYGNALLQGTKELPSTIKSIAKNPLNPDAQSSLIRAIKPSKSNVSFARDLNTAVPFIQETADTLGTKIENLETLENSVIDTKKKIWQQYEPILERNGNATIDGNKIADSMISTIDKRFELQNPGKAASIRAIAETYRKPITLNEAEDFLQSVNNELSTYYAKNKVKQAIAAKDPETGFKVKEAEALRKELNDRLGQLQGQDVGELKRVYGALTNIQNEVSGRRIVSDRQAPISLGQQISRISGVGDILKSAKDFDVAGVGVGVGKIVLGNKMRQLNDSNYLVKQAFEQLSKNPNKAFIQRYTPKKPTLMLPAPKDYVRGQTPATASNNVPINLPSKIRSLEINKPGYNPVKVENSNLKEPLISKAIKNKKIDPLIQEARKYKSAEDITVYRGGEKFDPSKMKLSGKAIGSYFSKDKTFAQGFTDDILSGKTGKGLENVDTYKYTIKKGANIATPDIFPEKFKITGLDDLKKRFGNPHHLQDEISKWALKNGFDVIDYIGNGKNMIILNPRILK